MPHTPLPHVTARRFVRALQRDGWSLQRQSGSHHHYRHPTKPGLITVSMHPGSIPPGTLRGMIADAGLTIEEFKALL